MKRYILIFCCATYLFINGVHAQSKWSPFKVIYKDATTTVEISYDLVNNSCESGNSPSRFKYNIEGALKTVPAYIVYSMDYTNCNGQLMFQENSINIGPTGILGVVKSIDFSFVSKRLITQFYNVRKSSWQSFKSGTKSLDQSISPTEIIGDSVLKFKTKATLSIEDGYLSNDAEWIWYKDKVLKENIIGTGEQIEISPEQSTIYFVRAEGKTVSTSIQKSVKVDQKSYAPSSIIGDTAICSGTTSTLSIKDGKLGLGADWFWYEKDLNSKPIGIGKSIKIKIASTNRYFVRAEGKLNVTEPVSILIKTYQKSNNISEIIGMDTICVGERNTLKIIDVGISPEAKIKWYKGECGVNLIGEGTSIAVNPKENSIYFVRIEGVCPNTLCIQKSVYVNEISESPFLIKTSTESPLRGVPTELSVVGGRLGTLAQWQWYITDCDYGKTIDTGQTIKVRPKRETEYFVKAIGKCNLTKCASLILYPQKRHSFSKVYDNSNYNSKFLHLSYGGGLNFFKEVISGNTASSSKISPSITTDDSTSISINGIGIKGELFFHPLIKKCFSLGFNVSYSYGVSPNTIYSQDRTGNFYGFKEKLTFNRLEFGTELSLGAKPLKAIIKCKIKSTNTSIKKSYEDNIRNYSFTANANQNRIILSGGLRIGRYNRKIERRGVTFDLLGTLTNQPKNSISETFPSIENNLANWRIGTGIQFWVQSSFKFELSSETLVTYGNINNLKLLKSNHPIIEASIIFTRDWFY